MSALTEQRPDVYPQVTGRPRLFKDVDELQQAIDAYFVAQDEKQAPYTMAGLARALDCSTSTLRCYETERTNAGPAFVATVKRARARVEEWTEARLYGRGHPAGPIFSLKNNFGWRDTQEIEHTYTLIAIGQLNQSAPQLEPPIIDVTPIPQMANENGVSPQAGDTITPPTFALDASLSPVPASD